MASTFGQAVSLPRSALPAFLAGLALFVLLFPWGGGVDPDPPTCFGVFGPLWMVPCEGGLALAAGVLMAGAVLLASAVARHRLGWPTRILLAALGGLTMYALQVPGLVRDSNPPICTSYFGHWTVPCGAWPPVVMGVLTGAVVLLALSLDELRS